MAASHARANAHADTSDRELVFTRVFDAPRELVFSAWTDPTHLAHWWGPDGFTLTIHEMDVTPGGVWRFIMHGPDGAELQQPHRLHRSRSTRAPGLQARAGEPATSRSASRSR